MQTSAPLELLADAAGAVTFGWAEERVYYARLTRSLSARLGETFAARLGAAVASVSSLRFFLDARELESYDLTARSAALRVLVGQRLKLEQVEVLWWKGSEPNAAVRATLGESVRITADEAEFEARLLAHAPQACAKLLAKPEPPRRSRWLLGR